MHSSRVWGAAGQLQRARGAGQGGGELGLVGHGGLEGVLGTAAWGVAGTEGGVEEVSCSEGVEGGEGVLGTVARGAVVSEGGDEWVTWVTRGAGRVGEGGGVVTCSEGGVEEVSCSGGVEGGEGVLGTRGTEVS